MKKKNFILILVLFILLILIFVTAKIAFQEIKKIELRNLNVSLDNTNLNKTSVSFENKSLENISEEYYFKKDNGGGGGSSDPEITPKNVTEKQENHADVIIYGATPAGIIAGIQLALENKSSIIISNGKIGGMITSGLSATDVGNYPSAIGGLTLEFFKRINSEYDYSSKIQENDAEFYLFEPKIAQKVINNLINEYQLNITSENEIKEVIVDSGKITKIVMNNDNIYSGKIFIDASYEGDLIAKSGISFTYGREARDLLNPHNGFGIITDSGVTVNPYVFPEDPSSEFIENIFPVIKKDFGAQDGYTQAYNYRLCVTKNVSNKIDFIMPSGYDESQFEFLARYIESREFNKKSNNFSNFFSAVKIRPYSANKYDLNNYGIFSTDYVGANYDYFRLSSVERKEIENKHKNYILGMLYFLKTSNRIPQNLKNEVSEFGLCKDEFQDNNNFPYTLYVRESRRMVSDYVLSESDIMNDNLIEQSYVVADALRIKNSSYEAIIDNDDSRVKIEGNWLASSFVSGYSGKDYFAGSKNIGSISITYPMNITGLSSVYLKNVNSENRASNVLVEVCSSFNCYYSYIDQRQKNQWDYLGDYYLDENSNLTIYSVGTEKKKAEDSIALGIYPIDSHIVTREIISGNKLFFEGNIHQNILNPYAISYKAIIPKKNEIINLLNPITISATHPAFCSIRVEPVYMMLGQSAAAAASLAINNNIPIQDVNYAQLKERIYTNAKYPQKLYWDYKTERAY